MVPNYLTVDPVTGAVGADFQGGVTIPTSTDTDIVVPDTTHALRFVRDSDGYVRSYLRRSDSAENLNIVSRVVAGELVQSNLIAREDESGYPNNAQAMITTQVEATGRARVVASAGTEGSGGEGFYICDNDNATMPNCDFITLGQQTDIPHTPMRVIYRGPYTVAIPALAAGASATVDQAVANLNTTGLTFLIPQGMVRSARLTWGYSAAPPNASTVRFVFLNDTAVAAAAADWQGFICAVYN